MLILLLRGTHGVPLSFALKPSEVTSARGDPFN